MRKPQVLQGKGFANLGRDGTGQAVVEKVKRGQVGIGKEGAGNSSGQLIVVQAKVFQSSHVRPFGRNLPCKSVPGHINLPQFFQCTDGSGQRAGQLVVLQLQTFQTLHFLPMLRQITGKTVVSRNKYPQMSQLGQTFGQWTGELVAVYKQFIQFFQVT